MNYKKNPYHSSIDSMTQRIPPLVKWIAIGVLILALAGVAGLIGSALPNRQKQRSDQLSKPTPAKKPAPTPALPDWSPVREEPKHFPRNSYLPNKREGDVSGSVDPERFSAGRDLIYVDDDRVWWESDNDKASGDDECDHSMHRALKVPFQRLVELVAARGGVLEVHDAFRAARVHGSRSLHKEGRALDLTCDQLGLEALAKLCWAAGFDWVYYECGKGGDHVHVSVHPDHGSTTRKRN
jgi:hypothetical protein